MRVYAYLILLVGLAVGSAVAKDQIKITQDASSSNPFITYEGCQPVRIDSTEDVTITCSVVQNPIIEGMGVKISCTINGVENYSTGGPGRFVVDVCVYVRNLSHETLPPAFPNLQIGTVFVNDIDDNSLYAELPIVVDTGYYVTVKSTAGGRAGGDQYWHEWPYSFDVETGEKVYFPLWGELRAIPRDGYEFVEWIASSDAFYDCIQEPDSSTSLYELPDPSVFDDGMGSYTAVFAPVPVPTEPGVGVIVNLPDSAMGTTLPVEVTFDEVTAAGTSSLTTTDSAPVLPAGFQLGSPSKYYDIETTATYEGEIHVVIDYSDVTFSGDPKLLHYEDTDDDGLADAWVDCTDSVDTTALIIYGTVSSLSPFAIVENVDLPGIKSSAALQLSELFTGDKKTDHKISSAIEHIDKSLAESWWSDEIHVTSKKVFDEEKKAINELKKLWSDEVFETVIITLVDADKLLATVAYEDALQAYETANDKKAREKIEKELDKCVDELSKAQEELEKTNKDGSPDPDYDKAIDHYKKVWEHAQHVLD